MNCVAKHTPETSKGFFYIYLPFYLILARFKKYILGKLLSLSFLSFSVVFF